MTATSPLYATGASTGGSTGWTNTGSINNARATGAPNGVYTGAIAGTTASSLIYTLSGYDPQSVIGTPSQIDSVDVTVHGYLTNPANYTATTVSLRSGTTTVATVPVTWSSTPGDSHTVTFTGVRWDQLASLSVLTSFTRTSGSAADTINLDAVGVVVNYTTGPAVYAGFGGSTALATASSTFSINTNPLVVDQVVLVRVSARSSTSLSLSDTLGNTYQQVATRVAGALVSYLFACRVTTGGSTVITGTFGAASTYSAVADFFYGIETTPRDIETTGSGTNTTSYAIPAFTAADGDVVYVHLALGTSSITSLTAPSGYVTLGAAGSTSNMSRGYTKIASAPEEVSFSGTTPNTLHSAIGASFPASSSTAPEVTVDAALSGSGTLSATTTPATSVDANLTGSGTLTATTEFTLETPEVTVDADLSGTGSLAATIQPSVTVSAPLSGSGALTGATKPSVTVTGALSGSGVLTATTEIRVEVTRALSGTGSLVAQVSPGIELDVELAGSGELTATYVQRGPERDINVLSSTGPRGREFSSSLRRRAIQASIRGRAVAPGEVRSLP